MATLTKDRSQNTIATPQVHVNERCVGCQECIIRCPTKALSLESEKWVAEVDNSLCVGCRQCERVCPVSAVTVEGPVVVAERTKLASHGGLIRKGDISEVRPGFATLDAAAKEAERCLNCPDPTCMRGCPAHNDIPAFIEAIRNRDLPKAQKVLATTTFLPDVCSRVCNWANQCEGACTWALAGAEPVAIGKLERFVTDNSPFEPSRRGRDTGKRVSAGIIGSGPAGIAAALELASAGASVTMYDRETALGGVMHWGIPSYVLPDNASQRPVKALVDAGVEVRAGGEIAPGSIDELLKKHDAVIVALGAPVPERPEIPGSDLKGVVDATTFLKKAKTALSRSERMPDVDGAVVAVLGGSNTALDVARSVLRLGGRPVVIHRREERSSRARRDEIAEAKTEGVEFRFATNISALEGDEGGVKYAVLVRTRQKTASATAEAVVGTESRLKVDMVVLATGYGLDRTFATALGKLPLIAPSTGRVLPDRRWLASGILARGNAAGEDAWEREFALRSSTVPRRERVWLIGDALTGPSTVVASMAQGKAAARAILEQFSGR